MRKRAHHLLVIMSETKPFFNFYTLQHTFTVLVLVVQSVTMDTFMFLDKIISLIVLKVLLKMCSGMNKSS